MDSDWKLHITLRALDCTQASGRATGRPAGRALSKPRALDILALFSLAFALLTLEPALARLSQSCAPKGGGRCFCFFLSYFLLLYFWCARAPKLRDELAKWRPRGSQKRLELANGISRFAWERTSLAEEENLN